MQIPKIKVNFQIGVELKKLLAIENKTRQWSGQFPI